MRKDNLYESVKKFVKTRKEDLNAYFTASLRIRKFIISCCENVCDWLWKQLPLIESRVFCRVWRLSRVALLIFYWLWFVVVLSFCANTKTHSKNLNWDFLFVSFYFIGKKGEALVTNRATYPVDDVVEPEDEDYIDATEGWWGVNISSVAYVDCVIFMLQMKSPVFLFFFFVNQVLGFRVKALKSSLPLPPSPPPPYHLY